MKKTLALLALTTALTVPALASARPVTFTVDMTRYGGDGAYVALYVTDSSGAYAGSLWMAGEKSKYYKHLKGWYQAARGDTSQVDGITGASVGAGRTLEVTLDLQDAIFDAGYTLHVDASVEDMRDSPREVSIPLTAQGASASGRTYIDTASYK
ncbi:MAG: DUF2271 domain-containing protein [Roseovarius sp.]|nr:DUF2271 domain-containing protein [Roseovarius sp.]